MSLKYRYTVTFNDGEQLIFENDRDLMLNVEVLQVSTNTGEVIWIPVRNIKKVYRIETSKLTQNVTP